MTDTPKRFPYGGGPARYVNPKLAAARGIEVADLPGEPPVYVEPAFDEETDDGSPALVAEPGVDLDFEAGWLGAENPADRAVPDHRGISAAPHLDQEVFAYSGWQCDCKATAKTGIPPRHYVQYCPDDPSWPSELPARDRYRVMIAPGRGETKQAKGETATARGTTVWIECPTWEPTSTLTGWRCSCPASAPPHRWDGKRASHRHTGRLGVPVYAEPEQALPGPVEDEKAEPIECPTWRWVRREWVRPARDWSKGKHGVKPPAPEPVQAPPPTHPAGPTGPVEPLAVAELPPRCTAKSLMLHATSAHRVTGRQTDDGPVVTRFRLSGTFDGRVWVAYWTEGKFAEARLDGYPINLAELRAMLKNRTTPTLL